MLLVGVEAADVVHGALLQGGQQVLGSSQAFPGRLNGPQKGIYRPYTIYLYGSNLMSSSGLSAAVPVALRLKQNAEHVLGCRKRREGAQQNRAVALEILLLPSGLLYLSKQLFFARLSKPMCTNTGHRKSRGRQRTGSCEAQASLRLFR